MVDRGQEARQLMAEAIKAETKTSFFGKKKPDWDGALTSYESAANIFKGLGLYREAVHALIKVAECQKNVDSLFMAAKAMENAALISHQNLNESAKAAELYKMTSDYFLAHGSSSDRAAVCMEKAAKALDSIDAKKSLEYYTEALDMIESEDRPRAGIDVFKRAISYAAKYSAWDKAINFAKRLVELYLKLDQKHFLNKIILTTVILSLAKGDYSEASNVSMSYSSSRFLDSEEGRVAQMFLDAMEQGDEELLKSASQSSCVKFLENEIAKIAMSLKVTAKKETLETARNEEAVNLQEEIEDEGFL